MMDLSIVYFPSAVTLGALHALEPGHAKTLTAAYLIGTKGTKRDAALLGVSVATTHSLVVVIMCLVAVLAGREAFAGEASHYLALVSSTVVILLGAWLLRKRLRALRRARRVAEQRHSHSHAPDPVTVRGEQFEALVEIIDTPQGERFRVRFTRDSIAEAVFISIYRDGGRVEKLALVSDGTAAGIFMSTQVPEEPHEFTAVLTVMFPQSSDAAAFLVHEPEHHHHDAHDHALLSDEDHARAHAADLPEYVARGERPTLWQIVAFGAAGGLVPCPAAITVMLLSLSLDQAAKGVFLVFGFGIGLALTLVGVGMLVVTGLNKVAAGGRLSRLTAYAPVIAAGMVIFSGAVGLFGALVG
jgi:nickel/cobalt exporter